MQPAVGWAQLAAEVVVVGVVVVVRAARVLPQTVLALAALEIGLCAQMAPFNGDTHLLIFQEEAEQRERAPKGVFSIPFGFR